MRSLASFENIHRGQAVVVCGCGPSLNEFTRPDQFITIGVDDVGRLFQPKYLVVCHGRRQFKGDRFGYIEASSADWLFTAVPELDVPHPRIVQFRLGEYGGTEQGEPDALPCSSSTTYTAMFLAALMGAAWIGIIGVDYTGGYFFNSKAVYPPPADFAVIDMQFRRLGEALGCRGIRVFNLSSMSCLTAFPKLSLEEFGQLPVAATMDNASSLNNADLLTGVSSPARTTGTTEERNGDASETGLAPPAPLSVIIVSHNEGDYLRRTIDSLLAGLPAGGKILVVDDASTDGSGDSLGGGQDSVIIIRSQQRLGVSRSRNLGARHANGKILVFSDAHIEVPSDWTTPLVAVLEEPTVGAVGPVITNMNDRTVKGYGLRFCGPALTWKYLGQQGSVPHPVPLLGGGFIAMRRKVFRAVGGFDEGMVLYGIEDAEMSLRLWLLGYQCKLAPSLEIAHLFRAQGDCPQYQRDWETVLHNQLRMAVIHLNDERIKRLIKCRADNAVFPAALTRLIASDVWARRAEMRALRRFDDDWLFHKFGME